jgi:transposase-like protein
VGKPGLKKVHRYSVEFKLTAVKLSHMPGIEVQTVANVLDIHPSLHAVALAKGSARRRAQGARAARGCPVTTARARSSNYRPSSASTRCSRKSTSF